MHVVRRILKGNRHESLGGGRGGGCRPSPPARADSSREATTVVIGIHPFVVGTPDGAAAMRRVLARLKNDRNVWLTDTEAILKAIDPK